MTAFVWVSVALNSLIVVNQLIILALSEDVRKRSTAAIGVALNAALVIWGLIVLGVFG